LTGTPVAGLILVYPVIQFKPVEGDALAADADFGYSWPHFGVETVAVHAEVVRSVA
jgi:hypothetical protein